MLLWWERNWCWPEMVRRKRRAYGVQESVQETSITKQALHSFFSD